MECKAQIIHITPTLDGADLILHMTGNKEPLNELVGNPVRLTMVKWRNKRSRDANAYFHVLVGKLADALGYSKAYVHNEMLRRYGQIQIIDGCPVYVVIKDDNQAEVDESEYVHLKPTAQTKTGKDGKEYRTYLLLRGSHEYDTKEMATLINGVVDECKAQGIETMTPAEIEYMMKQMEERDEKHHTK